MELIEQPGVKSDWSSDSQSSAEGETMTVAQVRNVTSAGVLACLLAVCANAVEPQKSSGSSKRATVEHASIAAYPNSVISLRDADTGMLFYVESNGRRLVAFEKTGAVKWSVDVFTAGNFTPDKGPAVIRKLSLSKSDLFVACGRSSSAKIDPQNGKVQFQGED